MLGLRLSARLGAGSCSCPSVSEDDAQFDEDDACFEFRAQENSSSIAYQESKPMRGAVTELVDMISLAISIAKSHEHHNK